MATKIEAENNELVLTNSNGDTIIIPKNLREEALGYLKANNHSAIDKMANKLPQVGDYKDAANGVVVGNNPIDPPKSEMKQGNYDVQPDITRLKEEMRIAAESGDNMRTLVLGRQLTAATKLGQDLGEFNILSADRTAKENELYATDFKTDAERSKAIDDFGYGINLKHLEKQKGIEKSIVSFDALKNRKYFDNPKELQGEIDRLGTIVSDKKQAYLDTHNDESLSGYNVVNQEYLDRQQEFDVSNNPKAYGGLIKAAKGLVIGGKKNKEEAAAATTQSRSQEADVLNKLQSQFDKPTTLDTPQVENAPMTEAEMYPSIAEFGENEVDIPKGILTSDKEVSGMVNKWMSNEKAFMDTKFDAEGEPILAMKDVAYSYNTPSYEHTNKCVGESCKAGDQFAPSLPGYQNIYKDAGIGIVTSYGGSGAGGGDGKGLDAWEGPTVIPHAGLGENLFTPKKAVRDYKDKKEFYSDMTESRKGFAKDFLNVPYNTMLYAGEAEGDYTKKGTKIKYTRDGKTIEAGSPEVSTRHGMVVAGIDEETGDRFVYNAGYKKDQYKGLTNTFRVGYSGKPGVLTPEEFMERNEVMYATSIKGKGDWTPSKIAQVKKHNRAMKSRGN